MIVAKTPLRLPLAGGLTDLKSYASAYGGVTMSMTIDKYVYVILKESLDGYFDLKYTNVHEKVLNPQRIRNDLIREALLLTGLEHTPVHIVVMTDLAGESGLGTSGAVCVSLLNAMYSFLGERKSKQFLLEQAAHIEVNILEGASGYHDPSICALGGIKRIEYTMEHRTSDASKRSQAERCTITAHDVVMSPDVRSAFEESLLFFYGGHHAKSKPSLNLLESHMDKGVEHLHQIKAIAYELEHHFAQGDLGNIARIIGEQQRLKMSLPGKFIDDYVRNITKEVGGLGAYAQLPGGKISAFVIVCCPDGQQAAVRELLADHEEVAIRLEDEGASVIEV